MAQRGYGEPMGGEWGSDERERDYDRDRERGYGRSSYGRGSREDERGFFERAGDEMRSWFGGRDEDDDRSRSERGRWSRDYDSGDTRGSDRDFMRSGREFGGARFAGGMSDRDRERSYGRIGRGGSDYMDQRRGYGRSGSSDYGRGYGPSRGGGYWESDRAGGMEGSRMGRPGGQQGWQSEYGSSSGQRSDWDDDRGSMYSEYSGTLGGFGNQRVGRPEDQFYMGWRDRQMRALDRDYEDYCREREQSFHQDFDQWRQNRQRGQGRSGMGEKGELKLDSAMETGEGSSSSAWRGSKRRSSSSPSADTTSQQGGASATGETSASSSDRT